MRIATVVLPVPGLPVKLMCSDGACAARPRLRAQLVDHQQRGDVADALLDRHQADQVAIEFVDHRLAPGCAPAPRRRCARPLVARQAARVAAATAPGIA